MISTIKAFLKSRLSPAPPIADLKEASSQTTRYFPNAPVHRFSDREIDTVNASLNWNAFTVDGKGRHIGRRHSRKKRSSAQVIPDYRILKLHQMINLKGKSVLEVGCFEGIHSVGLSAFSDQVTAIDSRIENIIKASARAYLYGSKSIDFKVIDIESVPVNEVGQFDIIFHCGVFYHLINPLKHLDQLGKACKGALFLDTHVMSVGDKPFNYTHNGKTFSTKRYRESGYGDVFSGMSDYSVWLSEKDLTEYLSSVLNFKDVKVLERRNERAGLRLAILATR